MEDLDLQGRLLFKWIMKKHDGVMWTGFVRLKIDTRSVLIDKVMKLPAPYHAGNLTISGSTDVSRILFHALCGLAGGHGLRYDT